MIEQLIVLAKQIIDLCNMSIEDNRSANLDVINIIKREFEAQYESLSNNRKAIVLNKRRDLWASRTITDSADFDGDEILFDKVFEFAEMCRKLSSAKLTILY